MKIRVGVEGNRRLLLDRCHELGAPILVSANSLFKRGKFTGYKAYAGHDTALDSGGFVAMKKYGGYRWSVEQYVALAKDMRPTWWAQMDFCCEPEIAPDRATIWKRIDLTAAHLNECQSFARLTDTTLPMPVLQGWMPEDYCVGPIYDAAFQWPALVGIGSVCRRQVKGPDGILSVVNALDRKVPRHVQFHLFGVKSTALESLLENFPHRIASVDSMAWNMASRWEAYHDGVTRDEAHRTRHMEEWYKRQIVRLAKPKQLQMQFTDSELITAINI